MPQHVPDNVIRKIRRVYRDVQLTLSDTSLNGLKTSVHVLFSVFSKFIIVTNNAYLTPTISSSVFCSLDDHLIDFNFNSQSLNSHFTDSSNLQHNKKGNNIVVSIVVR